MKVTKAKAAAAQDVILANLNEAGGSNTPGYVRIYDGTGGVPANVAASTGSNVLLAQCPHVTGSAAMFGNTDTTSLIATAATSGGIAFQDSSANASGTAAYWRLYDYADVARAQGTIGTSGAEMIVDTLTVTSGVPFTITSLTVDANALV